MKKFRNLFSYSKFNYLQHRYKDPSFKNKFTDFVYARTISKTESNVSSEYYDELFELKDKVASIKANLLSKDLSELTMIDNYKENFPYTVSFNLKILVNIC